MICSIKNIDSKILDELAGLQSKLKPARFKEILVEQGFHHDTEELFEQTTKTVLKN